MAEPQILTIDTGLVSYILQDARGNQIGVLNVLGSDYTIAKRYGEVIDEIAKINDEYHLAEGNMEKLDEVSDKIKKQIDHLLGEGEARNVFGKCDPLLLCGNGDFFFEIVLENMVKIIEKTTNQRVEKKLARINKATAKYR